MPRAGWYLPRAGWYLPRAGWYLPWLPGIFDVTPVLAVSDNPTPCVHLAPVLLQTHIFRVDVAGDDVFQAVEVPENPVALARDETLPCAVHSFFLPALPDEQHSHHQDQHRHKGDYNNIGLHVRKVFFDHNTIPRGDMSDADKPAKFYGPAAERAG